jgi:DNA mismatch repair protein MutS2
MTFPSDLEQKLGFVQIRTLLRNYSLSGLGLREVDKIRFMTDVQQIALLLGMNNEMLTVLKNGEPLPFSGYFDPEELIPVIRVEGTFLEEAAFHTIAQSLESMFGALKFLRDKSEEYPNLFTLTRNVNLSPSVLKKIKAVLDDEGRVRDSATPELHRIRRQLGSEKLRVRKLVDQVFRQASSQGWIPDGASPTIRGGRMVIPLLAEHKRKLRGAIHDESATGQTVFIEPTEVLEASNELRDLELAERREVIRVLKELTSVLRSNLDNFMGAYEFLGLIDLNRAKAKVSIDLDAHHPSLKDAPGVDWINARHPGLVINLKGKREVVPLNVSLTDSTRFLLVSGPNAGGKSVCLKTVGLIQYMIQCGLLVPLDEKSTAGIFSGMFIDIGDQQSIENDLSTYSSHLRSMDYFLRQASDSSLVLMDELGSGTDPNFGGGIAQAVLSQLVGNKTWGVATTHYYNLKTFAANTPGIMNGAMLFDTQNLQPLFVLETGRPGSSFALEIARKIGLPGETLQLAEQIIGADLAGLETLMKSVSEEKVKNVKMASELKQKESELNKLIANYEHLAAALESRKKEIIDRAKDEAQGLLKDTNREIEKTIRHIRENRAEKAETRKVRENLKHLEARVKKPGGHPKPVVAEKLKPGDKVRMHGQEVTGTLEEINGTNAIVQFGNLRSHVKVDRLVRSDQKIEDKSQGTVSLGVDYQRRQSEFDSTLDIRGKRVEDVLPLITRFMDDAVLLSRSEVRILHGKGEGVLRKVIRDYLRDATQVSAIEDEHADRGGSGITIVKLK